MGKRTNSGDNSTGDLSEHSENNTQQAMFLQEAIARQKKATANSDALNTSSGWQTISSFFNNGMKEEEELDDNEKRIKELEQIKAAQEEEIKALKSEMLHMKTSFRDESYLCKKQMKQLITENEAYRQKTESLTKELTVLRGDVFKNVVVEDDPKT